MNQLIEDVASAGLDLRALEQDGLTRDERIVSDHTEILSPEEGNDLENDPYGSLSFKAEMDELMKPQFIEHTKQGLLARTKKLEQQREKILASLRDPRHIKTKDKIAFTLGVSLTISTSLIAAGAPQWLPNWYIFWCISLLVARFIMYHSQKYHYFMLDFCYFSNLLLMFYLFFYPTSPHLYILNFANANGPLLWAIVTWRNSLVFHSLDKITSIFIHSFPPSVMYVLRFSLNQEKYATCLDKSCNVSFWWFYCPSIAFFLFWQICYLFKTEVIDRKLFHETTELTTSFRWLTKDTGSWYFKLIDYWGPSMRIPNFVAMQFVYHSLTLLGVKLMFDNKLVYALVMGYVFLMCIWNGANFYIDKFSQSYAAHIKELLEKQKGSPQTPGESPIKQETTRNKAQ